MRRTRRHRRRFARRLCDHQLRCQNPDRDHRLEPGRQTAIDLPNFGSRNGHHSRRTRRWLRSRRSCRRWVAGPGHRFDQRRAGDRAHARRMARRGGSATGRAGDGALSGTRRSCPLFVSLPEARSLAMSIHRDAEERSAAPTDSSLSVAGPVARRSPHVSATATDATARCRSRCRCQRDARLEAPAPRSSCGPDGRRRARPRLPGDRSLAASGSVRRRVGARSCAPRITIDALASSDGEEVLAQRKLGYDTLVICVAVSATTSVSRASPEYPFHSTRWPMPSASIAAPRRLCTADGRAGDGLPRRSTSSSSCRGQGRGTRRRDPQTMRADAGYGLDVSIRRRTSG